MPHIKAAVVTLASCAILYLLLKLSFSIISPFILSVFICIVIEPIIKVLMDKLHFSRSLSILVALLFFCSLFFICAFLTVSSIYREAASILRDVPIYYGKINQLIQKYYLFIKDNFNIAFDTSNITALTPEKILSSIIDILDGLKDKIMVIVYSMPDIMMYISFSLISSFFILRDKDRIVSLFSRYLPEGINSIISKVNRSIIKIAKSECILIGISTVQTIIGLLLLNVKYAVLIGFLSGILDILPVVGPGILFIPWVIYCFINGDTIFGISLIILYIIIIVTRQILETKFISGNLDVHPLIILISVYIGLKFFGVAGAILGPLAAVTIKMIYQENVLRGR